MITIRSNGRSKNKSILFWLLPLGVSLLVQLCTSFNGLYGQDAYEYLRYTQRLSQYWFSGESAGGFFWPIYYPLFGTLGSLLVGSELLSLQLLSALAGGGCAYCSYRILLDTYPNQETSVWWYTLLWVSLSPFLLRSGMLVMSDTLSIFWILLFFWSYLRYTKNGPAWHIGVLALSGALAVFTRYGSALILLLPSLYVIIGMVRRRHWLWFLGGVLILLLVATPQLLLKETHVTGAWWEHGFLQDWSWQHWIQRTFVHHESVVSFRWPNLLFYSSYLFHPGYCMLGSLFLVLTPWRSVLTPSYYWMLGGIGLYTLFLAGVTYQSQRYLLPAFLLMLICWYPAFRQVLGTDWWQKMRYILIPLIIACQLGLFAYSMRPFVAANRLERQIAEQLKAYPSVDLYTFYLSEALPVYAIPQQVHSLWEAPITTFVPGDLVLFNPDRFAVSWEGHTLMDNWRYLQLHYELETLETLPEGWQLYRVLKVRTQ